MGILARDQILAWQLALEDRSCGGLFAGNHGEAGPKSHRANKAAAGGKPAHRRAGAGLTVRAPSAVAGLHATKQGRCQKERKTAKRTLPGVFVMDRAGAGTAPAQQAPAVSVATIASVKGAVATANSKALTFGGIRSIACSEGHVKTKDQNTYWPEGQCSCTRAGFREEHTPQGESSLCSENLHFSGFGGDSVSRKLFYLVQGHIRVNHFDIPNQYENMVIAAVGVPI
eukprot:CAMPEP_0172154606 /NCGR_PEP_ID=MMETSP1050-20130122/2134_1 /TAXON_ID=233186 /ORGANISM="Cryptomonas curvata, Strain CCAP979/52" /LENGTH=227 /DNA_ID=CAMNT_0012823353 /DNA_START=177 /DNA_END=860 /DNA_ORIENTATION=-